MTKPDAEEQGLSPESVARAAARIGLLAHETPVMTSRTLNRLAGADLFFKCENLQRTGAFKIRGAANAVGVLKSADAAGGVATHSSGNHGAALACAAAAQGLDCHVVVPVGAVASKVANIRRYGGRVIECEATQAARENGLDRVVEETGANPVPPYDDPRIIAGQGTIALELMNQVPDLDALITPMGGGGMLSGCALWATHKKPDISIYGAEPAGADDAWRSLQAGRIVDKHTPDTVCDGLRAKLGLLNFALLRRHLTDMLTVDDAATIGALKWIMQTLKLVVEPSGAIALAAVLANPDRFAGQRVGVVLSGGNVDLDALPW